MRVGVALPNYGPIADAAILLRLARRAETLGLDAVWLSDHLLAPTGVQSRYPYDRRPDARPGDVGVIERFYEPLTTLAWLAGATERIRLGISAYVMPYRPPVVTAKQVATLDALSGGRVVLAVGVGWLREEFDALGVPFADRGRRTDEYLRVCRALWEDDVATFAGTHVQLPPVRTGPKPVQSPVPIWIAGNSDAARARAVRLGQGWHAIDLRPDALAAGVDDLRRRAAAAGRPDAIGVSLRAYGPAAAMRTDLAAYARAGCDDLVLTLPRAADRMTLERGLDDVAGLLGPASAAGSCPSDSASPTARSRR